MYNEVEVECWLILPYSGQHIIITLYIIITWLCSLALVEDVDWLYLVLANITTFTNNPPSPRPEIDKRDFVTDDFDKKIEHGWHFFWNICGFQNLCFLYDKSGKCCRRHVPPNVATMRAKFSRTTAITTGGRNVNPIIW